MFRSEYESHVEKAASPNVEESFKKFQDPDADPGIGRLPKFHQFFLVRRYICGKIFVVQVYPASS